MGEDQWRLVHNRKINLTANKLPQNYFFHYCESSPLILASSKTARTQLDGREANLNNVKLDPPLDQAEPADIPP